LTILKNNYHLPKHNHQLVIIIIMDRAKRALDQIQKKTQSAEDKFSQQSDKTFLVLYISFLLTSFALDKLTLI